MGALDILSALGNAPQDQYATDSQIKSLRDYDTAMQTPIPGQMRSPVQGIGDVLRSIMGGLAGRQATQYERQNYGGAARAMPNYLPQGAPGGPAGSQPMAPQAAAPQPAPQPVAAGPGMAADFGSMPQAQPAGGPSMPPVQATPAQVDRLTRTIMTEAGNEPVAGQIAVASVARNRLFGQGFGHSLDDVLTPNNFNGLGTDRARTIDPRDPAYQRSQQIAVGVLSGQIPDPTHGATHFYAPVLQAQERRPPPDWAMHYPSTGQIGGHVFYQDPASAPALQGAQNAARAAAQPQGGPQPQGGIPGIGAPQGIPGVGGPQPVSMPPQGIPPVGGPQGGPPQAQPMMAPVQYGLQQLPSQQNIQELARNPLTHQYAIDQNNLRQKQTAPIAGTTPAGNNFVGNPYTGFSQTPIPGMPHIENLEQQYGNVKFPGPNVPVYDKQGNFLGLHPATSVDSQGNPIQAPQGQGRGSDIGEPPINGTAGQKANYATELEGQQQAFKSQGEHNATMQQDYNAQGKNATNVMRITTEMRNLSHGINPNNASEIKEQIGNTLQSLGFNGDDVAKLLGTDPGDMQAFRKAASTLAAGITKTNFPRGTQNEFANFFNNATPNSLMTPQGLARVIQTAESGAKIDLQEQQAFTKFKNNHPASEWGDFPTEWHRQLAERTLAGEFNSTPATLGGPQATRGGPLPSPAEGPQGSGPQADARAAAMEEARRRGLIK